jgi:hypothetical protein
MIEREGSGGGRQGVKRIKYTTFFLVLPLEVLGRK